MAEPLDRSKSVTATLSERGHTHGEYAEQARVQVELARVIRSGVQPLSAAQEHALAMIATKISRIVTGNPHEPDHWHDIAGYASLVEYEIKKADFEKVSKPNG